MQIQKRREIENKYKWKLEDIFASDADWEAEFAQVEELLPQLEALKECITRDEQSTVSYTHLDVYKRQLYWSSG